MQEVLIGHSFPVITYHRPLDGLFMKVIMIIGSEDLRDYVALRISYDF
jgi:hypothetical protein